jgi:hypothetical protein
MDRKQAAQEIVNQINTQWSSLRGYVIGKKYPAIIELNGIKRKLAMFKKKSDGLLYVESMDELIYGTVFTVYKVGEEDLSEVGTRNLFSHTEAARDHNIAEFNAVFN